MFDFILNTLPTKENLLVPDPSILAGIKYFKYDFHFSFCRLTCYSHEEKESFYYESNSTAIIVYGKVFLQCKTGDLESSGPVTPADICNSVINGVNLLTKYKGNFTIIVIQTQNQVIQVINDHFAIKPLYYLDSGNQYAISNNLNFLRCFNDEINYTAVIERLLFTYPISSDTYLEKVKFLNGGELLQVIDGELTIKQNFDLEQFVFREPSEKFDYRHLIDLFNQAVSQRANCAQHVTASLTDGLDGRAIVSALLKNKKDFNTYSFGCRGGENTNIPIMISEIIPQVNYSPIWLNEEFEEEYVKYGSEVINSSDGLAFFERANYPFAFNMLSHSSRYVLTGLMGGELYGPVNMVSDYINLYYFNTFFTNKLFGWKSELEKKPFKLDPVIIENSSKLIDHKIENKRIQIGKLKQNEYGFLYYYHDLLSLGFRRYYGSEIHIERYYAENLTPFLDFDILDYIFSSDYKNIFRNAYNPNPLHRRNSKIFQSKVICQNKPLLGSIIVDRNFKPKDLLNPFSRLKIPALFYIGKYTRKNWKLNFDQEKWNSIFYSKMMQKEIGVFTEFDSTDGGKELNIGLSLALWLNRVQITRD
jgi:hypothetical protein